MDYTSPVHFVWKRNEIISRKIHKIYQSKLLHIGQFYISIKRETGWKQNQQ